MRKNEVRERASDLSSLFVVVKLLKNAAVPVQDDRIFEAITFKYSEVARFVLIQASSSSLVSDRRRTQSRRLHLHYEWAHTRIWQRV